MASTVREQISNAFANLGLAPATNGANASGHSAQVSSAEAVALEEEYSAHK